MITTEVPVRGSRERLDAEAREAHGALDRVVFWQFAGSGETEAIVREMRSRVFQFLIDAPDFALAREVDAQQRVVERLKAYKEVRAIVRRMAQEPAWSDNPLVQELLDQTLELEERLEQDETGSDPEWRVKEVIDHIGDLVTTLRREVDHNALDEPPVAARFVLEHLKGIDQDEVAELFGVDSRTLRDWKATKTKTIRKNPERVTLVAQLVYDLRHAMTPRGIVMWFKRSRPQLDGQTPLELIETDTGLAEELLRPLARGARGQLGT